MRNAVFFFLVTLLISGLPFAQEAPPAKEVMAGDELVQEKGFFAGTWIHPDADITRYSKLYLWDAVFQFREGGETSSGTTIGTSRGDQAPYAVRDESKKKFEQVVSDSFVKALGQSKIFEVVDEVGPNTLIVRAAVLDIVSDVPPTLHSISMDAPLRPDVPERCSDRAEILEQAPESESGGFAVPLVLEVDG